jgi:molecular chaperone GrpE
MTEEKKNEVHTSEEQTPQEIENQQLPLTEEETTEALKAKIAELESSVNQLKDQFLRKAAEFENYKRRVENDIGERIRFANEDLIYEILPVVDDFERSLKSAKTHTQFEVFYQGVDLIYQKLLKILAAQGVQPFESVGKQFDTAYHDALMQMPKKGVPPHTVIEEVEKGYLYHDKVLRHAKVIVSEDTLSTQRGEQEKTSSAEEEKS